MMEGLRSALGKIRKHGVMGALTRLEGGAGQPEQMSKSGASGGIEFARHRICQAGGSDRGR